MFLVTVKKYGCSGNHYDETKMIESVIKKNINVLKYCMEVPAHNANSKYNHLLKLLTTFSIYNT